MNTDTGKFTLGETHPALPSLRRIIAVRDIPAHGIKTGDRGGWIEREANLSSNGSCWVFGEAKVWGNARVTGDAVVKDQASLSGNFVLADAAVMGGCALGSGNGKLAGSAKVGGRRIRPRGFLTIRSYRRAGVEVDTEDFFDSPSVSGNAVVAGDVEVSDNAHITDDAHLGDHAKVRGDAFLGGTVHVGGTVDVTQNAYLIRGSFGAGIITEEQEEDENV